MSDTTTVTPRYLTTARAAQYTSLSEEALRAHRSRGTGPRFSRIGHKTVLYSVEDLDAWITAQRVEVAS